LVAGTESLFIVGILGGIASGKSLVADLLQQRGAAILDGDRAGHEVLRQQEVKQALRRRYGERVFDTDNEVDRKALAEIVFDPTPAGMAELQYLEQITHPRIKVVLRKQMEQLAREGKKVAVLDAPVMVKAGWDKLCNKIIFVDAPRPLRLERAKRRGWSEAAFERREAAQEPVDVKRALADVVIDNSGNRAHTEEQVECFWNSIPPTE